jgi:hypothetical protein
MRRNEKDFEIKQKVYNDFCKIGGDIINKVKKNGIGLYWRICWRCKINMFC